MANPFLNQYTPNIRKFIATNNKPPATNSIVPSYSRPLTGVETYPSGPSFRARPIKHWRKQLNPNTENSSGRGRAGLGMPMDTPGGSVYLGTKGCITCNDSFSAGIKEDIIRTNTIVQPTATDSFYDSKNNRTVCVACNPENNIIRSATTLLSKTYYSDTKGYLKSRCLLYDQKLSTTKVPGINYTQTNGTCIIPAYPNDLPDGPQVRATQNCQKPYCQSPGGSTAGLTIYKPSNAQFATQGAVSSSARIDRLKYNTITQNGCSFQNAWGWEGANAGRYQGTSTAPYFLKSKYQVPTVFHTTQNKRICCDPPSTDTPLVVTF
jgi:hypothetical protein